MVLCNKALLSTDRGMEKQIRCTPTSRETLSSRTASHHCDRAVILFKTGFKSLLSKVDRQRPGSPDPVMPRCYHDTKTEFPLKSKPSHRTSKQGRKMFLPLVDIDVFCCVSNVGHVEYAFISMDPGSLKPNVTVTCAITDHVRPCLPHAFPKAAVSSFSHIKRVSPCLPMGYLWKGNKKRPGHSWPEPGQACISPLTLQALVTRFMDTL